jgi:putative membrane protein insertion efficiency factor
VLAAPLLGLIWLYQKVARPIMPPTCRYWPSCSDYAVTALKIHGPFRGGWMAARRIGRCHPFHEGGIDPVPGSPEAARLEAERLEAGPGHEGCAHP